MMRWAGTLGLIGLLVLPALAEDEGRPPAAATPDDAVVWINTLRGQEIGRETVTSETVDGRWVVRSEGAMTSLGVRKFTQTVAVDPATFACVEYSMRAETAAGVQTVAATAEDRGVRFDVDARGQTHTASASGEAPILCMDNLVLAHYTVLGRAALAYGADGPFSFTIAVPSVMRALPAQFDPGEEVQVRLGDAVRVARAGKLTVAGLLTRVWYDAADGAPYRVTVPAQQFDGYVEHWGGVVEADDASTTDDDGSPASVVERDVRFTSPLGDVPGTWTATAASDPDRRVPAVVMLSGSGPNDRDETIGPNKPFRDLAQGLAEAGIATLRYDKRSAIVRTRILEAKSGGASEEDIAAMVAFARAMTLEEEYLVDARAALDFAARQDGVRTDAVFLLGHSLGGLVAPEIAAAVDSVRGVVLLAAPGRPFDALIESQIAFQARIAGMDEAEAAAHAREQTAALRNILAGDGSDAAGDEEFLNASAAYWRDLARRDAAATLAALDRPVLLLQGGKDIQITVADDYAALRTALEARTAAPHRARVFANLNHLFLPVEGDSTGAEYYEPGRVEPEVIATIAQWIEEVVADAD